ncbi:MAG: hypothetical protein HY360_25940 [Verrucomicrobia bacterium]|nr:hypothetical protein [Verrucomicrobiota bacterium]
MIERPPFAIVTCLGLFGADEALCQWNASLTVVCPHCGTWFVVIPPILDVIAGIAPRRWSCPGRLALRQTARRGVGRAGVVF